MMRKMSEELTNLGLIDRKEHESAIKPTDSPTDSLPIPHLRRLINFCPHDIGHYLGMDVHDCPEISKHVGIEPGVVITIEPGIYVKENDESVPAKYRGIGIRIEDDVAVTDNGSEVLSKLCPKEIQDVEKITWK
jgi:Xaa-Pro aminopeptidase